MSDFDNPESKPSLKRLYFPSADMNEPDTLLTPQVSTFVAGLEETPTPLRLLRSTLDLDSSVLGITSADVPQGDLSTADIRAIEQVNPFDEIFRQASAGQSNAELITGFQTLTQSQSQSSKQATPTSLTPTCTTPTCTTPKMREKYLRQSQYAQGQGVSSVAPLPSVNASAPDSRVSDAIPSQNTGHNNSHSAHSSSDDSPQSPVCSPSDSAGPPSKLSKSDRRLKRNSALSIKMPASGEEGTLSQSGESLPAQSHLPTRSEICAQFLGGGNVAVSTPTTAEVLDMVVNIEGGPRFPRFPAVAASLAAHPTTFAANANFNANNSSAAAAHAPVEQSAELEQSASVDPLANLRGGGGGVSLAAHEASKRTGTLAAARQKEVPQLVVTDAPPDVKPNLQTLVPPGASVEQPVAVTSAVSAGGQTVGIPLSVLVGNPNASGLTAGSEVALQTLQTPNGRQIFVLSPIRRMQQQQQQQLQQQQQQEIFTPSAVVTLPSGVAAGVSAVGQQFAVQQKPASVQLLQTSAPPSSTQGHAASTTSHKPPTNGPVAPAPSRSRAPLTAEEKRQRFLERNRAAAARCRQKRKKYLESLQKNFEETNEEGRRQKTYIERLEHQNAELKQLLLEHKECPLFSQQAGRGALNALVDIQMEPPSANLESRFDAGAYEDSGDEGDQFDSKSSMSETQNSYTFVNSSQGVAVPLADQYASARNTPTLLANSATSGLQLYGGVRSSSTLNLAAATLGNQHTITASAPGSAVNSRAGTPLDPNASLALSLAQFPVVNSPYVLAQQPATIHSMQNMNVLQNMNFLQNSLQVQALQLQQRAPQAQQPHIIYATRAVNPLTQHMSS